MFLGTTPIDTLARGIGILLFGVISNCVISGLLVRFVLHLVRNYYYPIFIFTSNTRVSHVIFTNQVFCLSIDISVKTVYSYELSEECLRHFYLKPAR